MKTPEEVVDEIDEAIEKIDELLEDYPDEAEKAINTGFDLEDIKERMSEVARGTVINYEPSLTIALDEDCRLQCRLSVETRTNAYQVRTGDYPEEQLSVYVTARQYGSLKADCTFAETLEKLAQTCHEMIEGHVIEHVLRPLARTIACK